MRRLIACWLLAFGLLAQDTAQVTSGGATIEVTFAPGKFDVPRASLLAWISNAANAVTEYFGRFPVQHPRVMVRPLEGRGGVSHGTTFGGRGAFTRISVGQATTEKQLDDDWMMTHEFIHMAFPDVSGESDQHHWMEEGMATYIEPIARAQIGRMTDERVWRDFVRDMPQGLPQAGDQGLDRTPTWGRTYWGGAIFWLLADVTIRERTSNGRSLDDALRAILAAGGTMAARWEMSQVIEVGDKATGVPVLAELYGQMAEAPVTVDLDALWKRLGVVASGTGVMFDEGAPLAAVRRAIVAP